MKVELLNYTPDGERLIAQAGKLCYSPANIRELREKLTEEEIESFINKLIELGHESPLEHISFTFGIEGVSRSLTHQLVRHRIASYSQKSQRYVKENQFEYIIPPAIKENKEAKDLYIKTMEDIQKSYDKLTELLKEDGRTEKKAIEDARYILPNGTETKIIVTMNARSLLHFFKLRTCNRAQWEIRELAKEMLKEVKKVYPSLFKTAGPSCITGPCPEGKMTCGKIKEVRKEFKAQPNNIKEKRKTGETWDYWLVQPYDNKGKVIADFGFFVGKDKKKLKDFKNDNLRVSTMENGKLIAYDCKNGKCIKDTFK